MKQSTVAMDANAPESFDFEGSMTELEAVVARLESGDIPLEEALATFERGVTLTRACQAALTAAEQKVERLSVRPDGTAVTEPFDSDGE